MKARNTVTGEVFRDFGISKEFGTASGIDENNKLRVFIPADGAFEIIDEPEGKDWDEFRCDAASRFMAAAYGKFGTLLEPHKTAKQSIHYADILIEELKKKVIYERQQQK